MFSVLSVSSVLSVLSVWVVLSTTGAAVEQPSLRVLFIGNSLTAANDLPAMVRRLGEADGVRVHTRTVTADNVSLDDHWSDGTAERTIRRERWDFVVLQQGPSSLPASRVVLRDAVRRFDRVIREAGARPAVYMVWPPRQRLDDLDRVIESHRLAAADVDAVLLPAGDAWRAALHADPAIALYGPDGFHPSRAGSWLAALTIYCGLTGRAPDGLGRFPDGFPEATAPLVAAASAALARPR